VIKNSAATPLTVNGPLVVSETMDGEAIVMHHGSGRYFDMTGSAAVIWSAIERGHNSEQIAEALSLTYGLEAAVAAASVAAFVETLQTHDLICDADTPPPEAKSLAMATAPAGTDFAPPVLGVHDDLADMLLLDPIHDVDDVGWPAPRPLGASE
jgi:hypothetical protein